MKTAIVILSDPKTGSEDAFGRAFNGLASAYDFKQNGDEVIILFQGTGVRWPAELSKPKNPAHALYEAVKDKVAGVSCGCADAFGATEEAEQSGCDLLDDNAVPDTGGLPSLRKLSAQGYTVLTF